MDSTCSGSDISAGLQRISCCKLRTTQMLLILAFYRILQQPVHFNIPYSHQHEEIVHPVLHEIFWEAQINPTVRPDPPEMRKPFSVFLVDPHSPKLTCWQLLLLMMPKNQRSIRKMMPKKWNRYPKNPILSLDGKEDTRFLCGCPRGC